MARIRTIKPEFWQDEKVGKLSILARLLFIGMNNFTDDENIIIGNASYLKTIIFPHDDISESVIKSCIDELLNVKFIWPIQDANGLLYRIMR
jgi:hypothetical protein